MLSTRMNHRSSLYKRPCINESQVEILVKCQKSLGVTGLRNRAEFGRDASENAHSDDGVAKCLLWRGQARRITAPALRAPTSSA